ncbi:docking protein 3 [Hemicordylus capensis]|uniref:docking protein 3 n=1 Tax=Hemicordylus capensis TaxID=884348 RepID=UPI002302CAE9|nr:docking protein 3 [Hemicordylus capensis]
MECPVKDGILYVQHLKFGKKTWRKVWGQLFADSPSGIARLEYFEAREGVAVEKATLRKSDRKVIRLSDCVSVERAGEHNSPKDAAPFYLCMVERSFLLAAENPDDWIECICQLAFQKKPASSSTPGNAPSPQHLMEENAIYSSWKETCEFPVVAFQTEASARCHLKGNYLLVPLAEHLMLKDSQSGKTLYTWPYAFLRRFGQEKTVFSFEAGRRCESGEGLFTFNTLRAAEIFRAVSAAIDCQKAALLETDRKAGVSPGQDCMQKAGGWSWPSSAENLEEMQPLYTRNPKEDVEMGLSLVPSNNSRSASPESGDREPPIIYASIGKSSPILFQPWGKTEAESKWQGEQVSSEHLYENLRALEQHTLGYRDFPDGNEPSPLYDNSPVVAKCSSSHPGLNPSVRADSSPETQRHPKVDCKGTESGDDGNAKPKARGAGAFKHKLVSMLSREGGASKTSSKNTSPVDKS